MIQAGTYKRAEQVFREALPHAKGIHQTIWPQVEVPEVRDGHAARAKKTKKRVLEESLDDQCHFLENAITTSMVVSMLCHFLSQKHGPYSSRQVSNSALQRFMTMGTALVGTLSFKHLRFGDYRLVAFAISADLRLSSNTIWTDDFFMTHLATPWAQYVKNPKIPWINTENPVGDTVVTLVEVLSFALDPQLRSDLSDALRPRALSMLGVWAYMFDTQVCPLLPGFGSKNKERVFLDSTRNKRSRPEVLKAQRLSAELIWSHDGEAKSVAWLAFNAIF